VQEEEGFSKTHIALTAPYRPNISHYDDEKIQYNEVVTTEEPLDLYETTINYANQKSFISEDEKFAYRGAIPRLKEMSSDRHTAMVTSTRKYETMGDNDLVSKQQEVYQSPFWTRVLM
jgi:hypothetical protein